MRAQLYADGAGFDPLEYNETAAVGFLVAAAGRAKMLALPEFAEECRKLPEGRVRAGRCDLWVASEDYATNWVIEFKLLWYGPRSKTGMVGALDAAVTAAFGRDRQEAAERWGCVLYCPRDSWLELEGEARKRSAAYAMLQDICDAADLAFELSGPPRPVYFIMKKVPRMATKLERHLLPEALLG